MAREREVPGLPEPTPWGAQRKRENRRSLQLTETSILRRLRSGQTVDEIARGLTMRPSAVHSVLYRLRKAFDAGDNAELLASPDVRAQLEG